MNRSTKLIPFALPALLIACSGATDSTSPSAEKPSGVGTSQASLRAVSDIGDEVTLPTTTTTTTRLTTAPISTVIGPIGTVVLPPLDPPNVDLRPDGAMRFYSGGATWGVQIDVVNIGTTPAGSVSGRVAIGLDKFSATLYPYAINGTPQTAVNPGQRGYIKINVPANYLSLCGAYSVSIDIDHTMQSGTNPFANDSRTTYAYYNPYACRLTWYRPINGATLGHEPDPKVTGKSLQDIVSSVEIARADGNKCSACHNSNSSFPYRPNVAPNGVSNPKIDPFQPASGTEAWLGTSNPWVPLFLELPDSTTSTASSAKPPYLKEALRKWLTDGAIH